MVELHVAGSRNFLGFYRHRSGARVFPVRRPPAGVTSGVAAGLWLLWPGVAEAWVLFTPAVRELTRQVVKVIRKGLEDLTIGLKLHRIQAEVRAEFVPGQKLMRVLGFNQEGPPMRKYGPDGADYLRYVRIRD